MYASRGWGAACAGCRLIRMHTALPVPACSLDPAWNPSTGGPACRPQLHANPLWGRLPCVRFERPPQLMHCHVLAASALQTTRAWTGRTASVRSGTWLCTASSPAVRWRRIFIADRSVAAGWCVRAGGGVWWWRLAGHWSVRFSRSLIHTRPTTDTGSHCPAGVQGRPVKDGHGGGRAAALLCTAGERRRARLSLACRGAGCPPNFHHPPSHVHSAHAHAATFSLSHEPRLASPLQDLRDLFRLEPSECEASQTQRELHDRHAHQRRESPDLTRHLAFLRTLDCYAGGWVVAAHDGWRDGRADACKGMKRVRRDGRRGGCWIFGGLAACSCGRAANPRLRRRATGSRLPQA